MIVFTEAVVLLLFLYFLILKRQVQLFSPVYIFLAYYIFIFVFGWFYSPLNFEVGGISADLALGDEDNFTTLVYGLIIVLAFMFGSILHSYLLHPRFSYIINRMEYINRFKIGTNSSALNGFVIILSIIAISLVIIGVGLSNLWSREEYLPIVFREAKIIGIALTPLSILTLGYIFLTVKSAKKAFIILLLLMFFLMFFSLASRWFALIPLMFFLGVKMSKPQSKFISKLLILSILLSFFLLELPLSLRSLESQGLVPYFHAVFGGSDIFIQNSFEKMMNNVLFSFSLTGYVALYENIELRSLLISINPLPSMFLDWYQVVTKLRININTPFNLPGELLNQGVVVAISFYFLLGLYFSRLDNKIRFLLAKNRIVVPSLLIGLSLLFIISSLQYNLRSGMRLLYYTMLFEGIVFALVATINAKKRNYLAKKTN